uniref:Rho-GAP domain-containing protein n=1 Tax=Anopheles atroparvus TaxID=41427 RepID=A0AAG5CZ53_ANOAO
MTDVEESIKVRLDQETANRLQDEHPEQFVTLVRMHLSFELDLNTDTENDPTGLDKQKIKKWKGFHKKAKGCTSVKAVSPEAAKTTLTKANIDDLKQLIAFLELEENISQEGIFRKTGSLARQSELKNLLVQGSAFTLDRGDYTAHDCASVLKSFLADLSEPLLTELYYPAYCQVADLFHSKDSQAVARGEDRQLNALQLLLLLLPEENNTLLRCIIELLHRTIQHEATNKMSAENLATLFTPHLICPRKLGPEALHTVAQQMSGIVGFMIKTGLRLFHIPARLATDIRAYFVEQKRRKTMSPEHILNESTTSDSVANTVYTFVDREKTAEAHIMNSTDTALAQLYAHIQSLPESSKKKKLVSKFNRQNGYGTPLQVLMQREKNGSAGSTGAPGGSAGPMKYPRSISDSIKRHIFHKSLMSRTPKRSAGNGCQTPITFQTPNGAHYSGPKQRVLFQSPVSSSPSPSPSSGSPAAACLQRCSSISSSTSSSSTLSLSSAGNGGTPARTYSSGSTSSYGSSSSEPVERDTEGRHNSDHNSKRRSTGEVEELMNECPTSPTGATNADDAGSERKRCRVEKEVEPCRLPKSAPTVRFGIDTVACGEEDGEPPPPEDDEDFVERDDDDIGGEEDDDEDRRYDDDDEDEVGFLLLTGGDEDCERTRLSDNEEDRYVISPGAGSSLGDTRSRYRSEPNLSAIVYQKQKHHGHHDLQPSERATDDAKVKTQTATPGSSKHRMNINFFKSKLIKGVSMGNLRFPFGNDSKTSKKHNRANESMLDSPAGKQPRSRATSKVNEPFTDCTTFGRSSLLPSTSRETVTSSALHGNDSPMNGHQRGWNYKLDSLEPTAGGMGQSWTSNYLSSTPGPSGLGGRNSMSPITKSTQRMPKSMQESIMTPRSRKPVILLAGMNGNDQQQLSTTCASFSSLREEDEEADLDPITGSSGGTISTCSSSSSLSSHVDPCVRMLINDTGLPRIADELGLPPADPPHSTGNIGGCGNGVGGGGGGDGSAKGEHESSSLTSTFRDYLLSRSVMPESPADLSFASQSDDFDSSSETLEQLSESKMSESMLYCMNGNEPKDELAGAAAGKGSTGGAPVFSQADNNHHLLGCGSELDETAL